MTDSPQITDIKVVDSLPAQAVTTTLVWGIAFYAQFETIHPFPDGNGRVGRALIHSLLRDHGVTRNVTVPISAGLLGNVDRYFDALSSFREGDANLIVDVMANAAFLAINNGRKLVAELQDVRESWNEAIQARRDSAAWKVADYLLRQPVVDSPLLQRELGVTAASINAALEHLEEVGVLRKISGNYRYRKWGAFEVLDAMDNFAERASRRNSPNAK